MTSHAMAQTSLDAYANIRASGDLSEKQHRLMVWMHAHPGKYTRGEIAAQTGIKESSVCGRVNELVKIGYLEQLPERRGGSSLVRVRPMQASLFQ